MDRFVIKRPRLNPELTSEGSRIPNEDEEKAPTATCETDQTKQSVENRYDFDFGVYFSKSVDDATKKRLLEKPWTPDSKFKFPSSGPRNLKFQLNWMTDWNWLAYSPTMDAAFCKFCALFSTIVGQQGSSAGKLVKTPFRKWKDAREDFKNHSGNLYHKKCLEKAANFLATYTGEKDNILLMLDHERKSKIIKNRETLKPIIKTAIFLAKTGQSFRGHRDSGPFDLSLPPQRGEGNFRSLLKFRVEAGDQILANHLETAGANATYISWRIQNEIISTFNTIILEKLVTRVNDAKFFSILCDETTDIDGTIQLSFCVRFVESDKVHEEFLQFIPVTETTGAALARTICSVIRDVGLKGENIVGQGYDGASSMSGYVKGVQTIVREEYPKAMYVHCCSHSLNLAISQGCSVPEIRNCMGTVEATYNFFNYPKRQHVLENQIEQMDQRPTIEKLKRLCATRWIQRHDSICAFITLLPVIIKALDDITKWTEKKTATDAQLLSSAICKSDFLLSLFVINSLFELTLPLSKYLQTENLDLRLAIDSAEKTKESLEKLRENAGETFSDIFQKVSDFGNEFDITISLPRVVNCQTKRNNVPASSPEEYYRRSIFIPFFDETIQAINDRFVAHKGILKPFQDLLTINTSDKAMEKSREKSMQALVEFYNLDVDDTNIRGEMTLWNQFLKDSGTKPKSAIEAISICNKNLFPLIYNLLLIMATLPVTTCTCERSFSTLKLLKTYLRNSTGEERLNGLALMFVHPETPINEEEVLNQLALKPRRLDILL